MQLWGGLTPPDPPYFEHCIYHLFAEMHETDFHLQEPHGDGLLVAELFFTNYPPSWEKIPPVEDPLAQLVVHSTVSQCVLGSSPRMAEHFGFPPSAPDRDWVIKGLDMYCHVYATGHIKDPMPLIEKRRGLSPGGRFPPRFIHQVIIITGLNKLYNYMFSP